MKIKELIKVLSSLNPEGEVSIVDNDQNNTYNIIEVRTCDDHASKYYNSYADIVINI